MGGYQASFQFNLTDVLQAQGDHIAACIDYVRRNGSHDHRRHPRRRGVVGAGGHRAPRQDLAQRRSARPATTTSRASCNRRQDGNYNGGFPKYIEHMASVRDDMERHFTFT